jgi:hypothetical protein
MPLTVRDKEERGTCPVFVCDVCGAELTEARNALMGWIRDSEGKIAEGPLFYCVGECARSTEARATARDGLLGDTHLSYALVNMVATGNVKLPDAVAGALAMAGFTSEEDDVADMLKVLGVKELGGKR